MRKAIASISKTQIGSECCSLVDWPLQLRRIWPGAGDALSLEYIDAEGRSIPGRVFVDPSAVDKAMAAFRACGQRAMLADVHGHRIVLQPAGVDWKLVDLHEMIKQPHATLISHRPGKRAVVRLDAAKSDRVYVKIVRPTKLPQLVARQRVIEGLNSCRFETAPLVSIDEHAGHLVMGDVAGQTLHDAGQHTDEQHLVEGYHLAGCALRSLHVDGVALTDKIARHDAQREADMLRQRIACARKYGGSIGRVIGHVADSVLDRLAGEQADSFSTMSLIHRDFYDKQVVLREQASAGTAVTLLDFDTLALGESALDVANMLGHIELRQLQGMYSGSVALQAMRAFVDGYGTDGIDLERVRVYLDTTRLRLGILYAFWPRWDALAAQLAGRVGSDIPVLAKPTHTVVPSPDIDSCTLADRMPGDVSSHKPVACPLVFVVGSPRSGTTMLERMLDAHGKLAMAHETHWITKHDKPGRDLTAEGCVHTATIDALYADKRFVRMAPERSIVERWVNERVLPYSEFVRRIYDAYRLARNADFVGDKSTGGHLRNLRRLHQVCQQAKIVHLIRDGRDVCLSMLGWKKNTRAAARSALWQVNPVATTALWWQWQVRKAIDQGRSLGDEVYREVRYESLVADPAGQCSELCGFLGLEYDEAMITYYAGRSQHAQGSSANAAWLPPTQGLRDWKTQMREDDIEMFEAIAGSLLDTLGYQRRYETISRSVAALAAEYTVFWNEEVFSRREKRRANECFVMHSMLIQGETV